MEKIKQTVKAVISPRDSGLRKIMHEYTIYKEVLIPKVQKAVRPIVKDKTIAVYAQQKWMIDKKLNKYLNNLPFHPMPFHNQSVFIENKDGKFWIHFKTKEGEAVCYLYVPAKYRSLIEQACGEDNPVLGQVEIVEDHKYGWVNCHICLRLPKPEPYDPKGWVGVDVGWNKLATSILTTVNPHLKFSSPTFHGKQFKSQIIQLRYLLKQYARKGKDWKKWNFRLKHTIKYAVGVVAKEIVSKAKNLKAGVAMEKLTFKSTAKGYMVPRYKLMTAVKTLCEREGVPFKLVSPKNTSLLCPKCANIKSWESAKNKSKSIKEAKKKFQARIRKNRNRQRFSCVDCGYKANADIVGAMNIAKKAFNRTADGAVNGMELVSMPKTEEASCLLGGLCCKALKADER